MAELIRTEPYSFSTQVLTTLFLRGTPAEFSGPLVLSAGFEPILCSVTDLKVDQPESGEAQNE
jgi:hypothetical protein